MSIRTINVGNVVNDGLGDDLRTAFQKVNANFGELAKILTVDISTSGSGSSIVKEQDGNTVTFKSIVSGRNILVDDLDNSLQIINTAPDAFTRIHTNSEDVFANQFQEITIQGGLDIEVNADKGSSVITVDNRRINNATFTSVLSNYDFGPIDGGFKNAVQLAISSSNIDFGTIEFPGRLNLDCGSIVNQD
jgi:hypothetical protein